MPSKSASPSRFPASLGLHPAPGCKVPALTAARGDRRLRAERRTGTSLAAPFVSFAAALVRSETGLSADNLKRRILTSADLSADELAKHVVDGRRLNVIKAVAVTVDVLETTGGPARFGTARFVQGKMVLNKGQKIGLKL